METKNVELKTQEERNWFRVAGRQIHLNHISGLKCMIESNHPQSSFAKTLLSEAEKRLSKLDDEMRYFDANPPTAFAANA